ncbi:unnamed protein product [Schistosoma margrebowiei]|uniref:Uncharacterized protein n=1 Tax=Schistosoma margrebowiei TaxID=48269 RepID=A0A183LJH4_9TREM|nr:unnamed protein product [Schistosoma margrebowiei]
MGSSILKEQMEYEPWDSISLRCSTALRIKPFDGGWRWSTGNPGLSGFVLLGTRQQDVHVILREPVLLAGFDPVSPRFTIRNITTDLSGPRPTSTTI